MPEQTISISNAKRSLNELVDSVRRAIILRRDEQVAALLSIEEYRALVAAAERARDPEHAAAVLERHRRVQGGDRSRVVDFSRGGPDELRELARAAKRREPLGPGG